MKFIDSLIFVIGKVIGFVIEKIIEGFEQTLGIYGPRPIEKVIGFAIEKVIEKSQKKYAATLN